MQYICRTINHKKLKTIMKKLFLIAGLIFFAMTNITAQENVVKINPLAILGGTDLVSYERAFSDKTSGVISAGYGGFKFGSVKYSSVGGGLQYRYYFNEVLSGWYGAARVSYQSGEVESETITIGGTSTDAEKFNFSAFGAGLNIGHQWIWDSGFSLDLNLWASYKSFDYDFDNAAQEASFNFRVSGILPTFGFGLGYAF
jgi:hypothetical protein